MDTVQVDPQLTSLSLPLPSSPISSAPSQTQPGSSAKSSGVNVSQLVNSTNTSPKPSSVSLPPSNPNKRKLHPSDDNGDHQSKVRRISNKNRQLFQLCCEHPAVAQKSYGSEKRFLCPPPFVHIEGPASHLRSQLLTMSVVAETGERSPPQKASLDNHLMSSFKSLHVQGTAKAKSFSLSLDLSDPSHDTEIPPGRVWASFESAPVTIISKPSKKTAKARNIASCILEGGPVSLFNRINSQTVRTKYMAADREGLCASGNTWSAFNVNVIRRPPGAAVAGPQPVTYGCEIVLSDTQTGITTPPLIIRKIEKTQVSSEDGGPVSQMQKIVLQRVNEDGSRNYLSAAGPVTGASNNGASSSAAPISPNAASQVSSHPLVYGTPRTTNEVKDGVRIVADEVDDYLCWTIVGISKFQYTFFNAFGPANSIPVEPVTPFPTLFTTPVYRPTQNTLELTVSNFFYQDPKSKDLIPLEVYLGNLGPLRHRAYQANPLGSLTNVSPFVQQISAADGNADALASAHFGPLHTIVIVEMPALPEILQALDEESVSSDPNKNPGQDESTSSNDQDGPTTSLTPRPRPHLPPFSERSLPLLFVRNLDGVGYHSGRSIACDVMPPHGIDIHGNPTAGLDPGWNNLTDPGSAGTQWALRIL